MKTKNELIYTDEPKEDGWDFDEFSPLSPEEQAALGIPTPEQARHMRVVRRAPKPTRINIRLAEETLDGLKARAAEAGIPYQTLAASVLRMVASGRMRLTLTPGKGTTP